MYGRYGTDNFYMFLSVLVLVLILIDMVVRACIPNTAEYMLAEAIVGWCFTGATLLLLIYACFRTMSRNIAKRRRENMLYLQTKGALKRFFTMNTSTKTKSRNMDDAYYIFRDCTKCNRTLRLPKKAGRHAVKCPGCGHRFYVKAK